MRDDDQQRWPHEPEIATEWPGMGTERWPDEPPAVADDAAVPVGIDPETGRRFIAAAVYANVALAGLAIGGLLVGTRGAWGWGSLAVTVGVGAALQLARIVRTQTQE
jgi:hypothetical protein